MRSDPAQSSVCSQIDIEFECLLFLACAHQARQQEIQMLKTGPVPQPELQAAVQPGPTFMRSLQTLLKVLRKSEGIRAA